MIIKIDTKIWCTQKEYSKLVKNHRDEPMTLSAISMGIKAGRIESWTVPVIGITLVKRP